MNARTLLFLLALSSTAGAQQYTNSIWPPRDIGMSEFITGAIAASDQYLAVADARQLENQFIRVYKREGLNWLEDARLYLDPRTPVTNNSFYARELDVDGARIVAQGQETIHVFERVRERIWSRT